MHGMQSVTCAAAEPAPVAVVVPRNAVFLAPSDTAARGTAMLAAIKVPLQAVSTQADAPRRQR